jgi:hypothetical protein
MPQPSLPFSEESFGQHRKVLRSPAADERGVVARVLERARQLWPQSTAFHLSARARVTERAAENWLMENTGMSAPALAGLLRSDAGLDVLKEVMGEASPAWWADVRRFVKLAELERLQALEAALIADLERESAHARTVGGLLPVAKPSVG